MGHKAARRKRPTGRALRARGAIKVRGHMEAVAVVKSPARERMAAPTKVHREAPQTKGVLREALDQLDRLAILA